MQAVVNEVVIGADQPMKRYHCRAVVGGKRREIAGPDDPEKDFTPICGGSLDLYIEAAGPKWVCDSCSGVDQELTAETRRQESEAKAAKEKQAKIDAERHHKAQAAHYAKQAATLTLDADRLREQAASLDRAALESMKKAKEFGWTPPK